QTVLLNHKKYVPIVVKISPDISEQELHSIASILLKEKIDGVIATNTTIQRNGIENSPYAKEAGGLSGRPLLARSNQIVTQLYSVLQDQLPIIASGGVMDKQAAQQKYAAGAKLLQVYSGFIYSGPGIVSKLVG